jgi:hypothetical protein
MDEPLRIGQTQDEFEAEREKRSNTTWIKYFKPGDTRIRVCQTPVRSWITAGNHYDPVLRQTYPCVSRYGRVCVGCKSPNEWERAIVGAYYFNALDSYGDLGIYRAGSRLKQQFEDKENRAIGLGVGNLTDYDVIVVRTGTGKDDTRHDVELQPPTKIEGGVPGPDEWLDIHLVLGDQYTAAAAVRAHYLEQPSTESAPAAPKVDASQPITRANAAAKVQPPTQSDTASTDTVTQTQEEDAPPAMSNDDLSALVAKVQVVHDGQTVGWEDFDRVHMMAWLKVHGVEGLPANSSRGILTHKIKEKLLEGVAPF